MGRSVNGLLASRAPIDLAVHSCPHCGLNMCVTGSMDTNTDGFLDHRIGDMVCEFCGVGVTVTGSCDDFDNG